MNNKKAQEASAGFEPLIKILLAVIILSMILTISTRGFNEERAHHIHTVKSAGLNIDALMSIEGDAIIKQEFLHNIQLQLDGKRLNIHSEGTNAVRSTNIRLPQNKELDISSQAARVWYFSKQGNTITVSPTRPETTCNPHLGEFVIMTDNQQFQEFFSSLGFGLTSEPTQTTIEIVESSQLTIELSPQTRHTECLFEELTEQIMYSNRYTVPYIRIQIPEDNMQDVARVLQKIE